MAHGTREAEKCAARYEWNAVRSQLKGGKNPQRLKGIPPDCLKPRGGNPFPEPIKTK
jgi:hypothetical protein